MGKSVIVWGRNLLGTTAVSFNGVAATTFANISRDFVSAAVPARRHQRSGHGHDRQWQRHFRRFVHGGVGLPPGSCRPRRSV